MKARTVVRRLGAASDDGDVALIDAEPEVADVGVTDLEYCSAHLVVREDDVDGAIGAHVATDEHVLVEEDTARIGEPNVAPRAREHVGDDARRFRGLAA